MNEAKAILKDIKAKRYQPVYFLGGEEPYFIDVISDYIQDTVLQPHEKDFNLTVLYGKETNATEILSACKRYPMMSDYQVVIVKEAQSLGKQLDNLLPYFKDPLPTTILVICSKYKKPDKRKKAIQLIAKTGLLFESKKLYENQVGDFIASVLSNKGYAIEPKAAQMLVEFLGTDLAKINNELQKLQIIIPKGSQITPLDIEQNIGISKDFNVFELNNALSYRDQVKAFRICNYFTENPKEKPIVVTVSLLFIHFSKVMQYHGLRDKSENNVASKLRVSRYFVKDYVAAARNYPMKKVSYIIEKIRIADVKSKGVGASQFAQSDILKELLVQIFS